MTTIIEGIAERIGDISYSDLPPDAVHWAKAAILDTVGVHAGRREPSRARRSSRACCRPAPRSGECLIFGTDRRAAPLDAALINGTAAHALDFDDVSNTMGGHPSAPILPALFALGGDRATAPGAAFIAAYVAGFETETRIAPRRQLPPLRKGLAPDRDARRVRRGRRVLPSDGSRPRENRAGAGDRRLARVGHQGQFRHDDQAAACRAHARATACSRRCWRARGSPPTTPRSNTSRGFCTCSTAPAISMRRRSCRLGSALRHRRSPASRSSSIRAAAARIRRWMRCWRCVREHEHRRRTRWRASNSWTHPRRLAHTDRPDPQTGLDAKFSVQYCLARALLDGRIVLEHFEGEAFRDPAARALMRRIHAAPFPATARGRRRAARRRAARSRSTTAARSRSGSARALGRGTDNPLPEEALHAQIRELRRPRARGGSGRTAAAGAVAARRGRQPARCRRGDGCRPASR